MSIVKKVETTEYFKVNSARNKINVDRELVNWLFNHLSNNFNFPMSQYLKEYKYVASKFSKQLFRFKESYAKGSFMYIWNNHTTQEVDRSIRSRVPVIGLEIYNGKIGYGSPKVLIHYKLNGSILFEIDLDPNLPIEQYVVTDFIPSKEDFLKYMLEVFKRISI